jgi:hypothetical protein
MKLILSTSFVLFFTTAVVSQTAITAVTTTNAPAASSTTYTIGANTYNWGLAPNNNTELIDGFTAGGVNFTYAPTITGSVKLRRVNNGTTSGNFTLVWAQAVTGTNVFNMLPNYVNDMEPFFSNRAYNKGTDNMFDNTSANSNNIERLDWISTTAFSTATPSLVGFSIFERGAVSAHDPFAIAAITSLDAFGNPASYSSIVRVGAGNYGDPGPNVTYRILKAAVPANLADATGNTQNRGGVIVSLQNLGITAGQPVYGYSLFSNDLPVGATPANLVDFTNTTYFPTNTGGAGGIDLIAVTGVYIEANLLPLKITDFRVVENAGAVTLFWDVENEAKLKYYEVERSLDGIHFLPIAQINGDGTSLASKKYSYKDVVPVPESAAVYYRIKQYDVDGSFYFTKIVSVKKKTSTGAIVIFPNPVTNNLFVKINSSVNATAQIAITDISGRILSIKAYSLLTGNNFIAVDNASKLTPGTYQLVFTMQDGTTEKRKFVKQ